MMIDEGAHAHIFLKVELTCSHTSMHVVAIVHKALGNWAQMHGKIKSFLVLS